MSRRPKDDARILFEAARRAGLASDPEAIKKHIQQLQRGLPAEDEFAALCVWSGTCPIIHGLRQEQFPTSSKKEFQVPDFMAVFDVNGKSVSVLIEVKSTDKSDVLKFTAAYHRRLQAYASAVGLPLLVAWRERYGFWTLFDIGEMAEGPGGGWKVEFPEIMKQSLTCVLLGDFTVSMKAGIGLTIQIREDRKLSASRIAGTVTAAYWNDPNGNPVRDLSGSFMSLFLSCPGEVGAEKAGNLITQKFFLPDDSGMWAQSAMLASLMEEQEPNWLEVLRSERVAGERDLVRKAAIDAMDKGMIAWIGDVQPQKRPPFLPKLKAPKKRKIQVA